MATSFPSTAGAFTGVASGGTMPTPVIQPYQTGSGQTVSSIGNTGPVITAPKTPAVVTAQPAQTDLTNKQNTFDNIQTGVQNQSAIKAATPPTPANQIVPGGTFTDTQGKTGVALYDPMTGKPYNPATTPTNDTGITTEDVANTINGTTSTGTTTGTTPTTPTTIPGSDNSQYIQNQNQITANDAEKDTILSQLTDSFNQLRQGIFPLTGAQNAIISATQAQLNDLVTAQKLANANLEGGITAAGIAAGRNRYAPEVELGNIKNAVDQGISKISKIENDGALSMAKLEDSFQTEDYNQIDTYFKEVTSALDQKNSELISMNDKITAAAKDARDFAAAQQKAVTDGINTIATEAAKNGADPKTIAAISGAKTVTDAINAAGGSLQTATGQLGDYLQYKRDAVANGQAPEAYATWKIADDAQTAKEKESEAYGTAFATAKGKAAGEASANGNLPQSPVTSPSGITYNAPASIAPYVSFSSNGVKYVDLSNFKGTPTEANQAVADAQAAGYKIITNKNTALDVQNITDAMNKLGDMKTAFSANNTGSAAQRDSYGAAFMTMAKALQTDPNAVGTNVYQDTALDILKAMSGVQGFRGGASIVDQVKTTFPQNTDTQAVVDAKIGNLEKLIGDRETALVGKPSASDQLLIDSANAETNVKNYITSNPSEAANLSTWASQPNVDGSARTSADVYQYLKSRGKVQ